MNLIRNNLALMVASFIFASIAAGEAVAPATNTIIELSHRIVQVCGGSMIAPSVRILPNQEFQHRLYLLSGIKSENISQSDYVPAEADAFYDEAAKTIFWNLQSENPERSAFLASEVPLFRRIELCHELVHAWQFQNLPRQVLSLHSTSIAIQAILEGQAEYVSSVITSQDGKSKLYQRILADRVNLESTSTSDSIKDDLFKYLDGYRFVEYAAKRDPPVSVGQILSTRVPTEKEIAFPDEYFGQRTSQPDPSRLNIIMNLVKLLPTSRVAGTQTVEEIGFLKLREHLSDNGLVGSPLMMTMRDFVVGKRATNNGGMVNGVLFVTASAAHRCFTILLSEHRRISTKSETHENIINHAIGYFAYRLTTKASSVIVILLEDRSLIIEATINDSGLLVESDRALIDEWIKRYLQQ